MANNATIVVCPDDTFGPWAGPDCRAGFDFTLFFEETILSLLLVSIFIFAAPIRLFQTIRLPVRVTGGPLRLVKLVSALYLAVCNVALVGLWSKHGGSLITKTSATIPSAALSFIASILVCMLSWMEHERSMRPGFLHTGYLYLSVLLDLARLRTLWLLRPTSSAIPALFAITIILRLVTAALESFPKHIINSGSNEKVTPEALRGPLSTLTFQWLMPLLKTGYKQVFMPQDLYPLDNWLESRSLHETLQREWEKVPDKTAPNALMSTWLRVFSGPFLAPIIPKIFVIGFTYAQPLIINSAVSFASTPKGQPWDNYGYGLIGALFLVYFGIATSIGQYNWRVKRMAAMSRGSIVGLILHESLMVDPNAPGANALAALTLANADAETIQQGLDKAHDTWAGIVEIVIADYLIWRQMGAACAMPIAVAFAVIIGSGFVAVPTGSALGVWLEAISTRVVKIANTLGAVKWIKMSGLAEPAFQTIQELRLKELRASLKCRILMGATLVILTFVPVWSPIFTFSLYAGLASKAGNILQPATIYTAYSLIVLLNSPFMSLTMSLPAIIGAMTAFGRIQAFLTAPRRVDNRNMSIAAPGSALADSDPSKMIETVTFNSAKLADDSSSSINSLGHEMTVLKAHARRTILEVDSGFIASVQGTFRWSPDAEPIISIDDLVIPRKKVTVILGPVGCGKSTLMKALLGELSGFEGTIRTNFSGVAYCDQNPWIPNDKIRNIICGWGDYNEKWYRKVIKASELEHDLSVWPGGDQTQTASTGLALSGGQKHRLALARALYAGKELLILDDLFKTLDAWTAARVLENLWGYTDGILRSGETTTIFASSDEKHLAYADYVVALDEKGCIRSQGPTEDVADILDIYVPERSELIKEKDSEKLGYQAAAPAGGVSTAQSLPVDDSEFTDQTRRLGDKGTFRAYATAAGWSTFFFAGLGLAVYAFCESFPTILLGMWSTESARDPHTPIGKWLGLYFLLGVGSLIGSSISVWLFMVVMINKCGVIFHEKMLKAVAKAPMSFFSSVDAGTTLIRFNEDIRLIDMEIPGAIYGMGTIIAFLIAQFGILAYVTRYILIAFPIVGVIFYVMQHFYLRTSRQLRLMEIELEAPISSKVMEISNGLVSIRAFGWKDKVMEQSLAVLDNSQRPSYLLHSIQCWLNFAIEMLMLLLAVVFFVITIVLRSGGGGAVTMGVGLTSLLSINTSVKMLIQFWVMLENALGAITRVARFTNVMEENNREGPLISEPNDPKWPSRGGIDLHNVTASYPSSGTCLDGVTFSIKPGQKIAICGRTGSGKSSLVLCLMGMMDLDAGSIVMDGIDIATLPRDFLQTRVVACPQEPFIMDNTVRYNVDPSGNVEDAKIQDALERVQMWNKIESIGGLDAAITQDTLSMGEAQLLVLARAMLRDSRILVLDEPTRSLDGKLTEIAHNIIQQWFRDWTVISVTHSVDGLLDYDAIAVLKDGKLVSYGPQSKETEKALGGEKSGGKH